MKIIPSDTTIDAAVKQFEILRRLGAETRAEMTIELSNNLRSIVEAGVRHRHPDYDEQTVKLAVLRLTIGEDLFREAFGDVEVQV